MGRYYNNKQAPGTEMFSSKTMLCVCMMMLTGKAMKDDPRDTAYWKSNPNYQSVPKDIPLGWAAKNGNSSRGQKGWKLRWFYLSATQIQYREKGYYSAPVKGVIELVDITSVQVVDPTSFKHFVTHWQNKNSSYNFGLLIKDNTRDFRLAFSTSLERDQFQEAVELAKGKRELAPPAAKTAPPAAGEKIDFNPTFD